MMRRPAPFALCALLLLSTYVAAQDPNGEARSTPQQESAERGGGPLANTTAGSARVIVPDGTSVFDTFSGGTTQWFTALLEGAKGYTLEIMDSDGDLGSNHVGTIGVFESDGVTPLAAAQVNCATRTVAPSLEVGNDGERCVIRTFIGGGSGYPKAATFSVTQDFAASFHIRLRESTIYSRWSTNGYDMHVELQNTTSTQADAQLVFYPDTGGATIAGFNSVTVPDFGSAKVVRPAGLIGSANKGTLRIIPSPSGTTFVTGQVNANVYGFNTGINQFLFFNAERVNDGRTANTW